MQLKGRLRNYRLTVPIIISLVVFVLSIPARSFAENCSSSSQSSAPAASSSESSGGHSSGFSSGVGVSVDVIGLLGAAAKKKGARSKKKCCELKELEIVNVWDKDKDVSVTITGTHGAQTKVIRPRKIVVFEGDFGECVTITVKSTDPNAPNLIGEEKTACCKDLENGKKPSLFGIQLSNFSTKECGKVQEPKVVTPKKEVQPPPKETKPPVTKKEETPKLTGFVQEQKGLEHKGGVEKGGDFITTFPEQTIPERVGIDITKCDAQWLPTEKDKGPKAMFAAHTYLWDGQKWVKPGPPKKIVFKLSGVSHERGVCMNKGDQTTPDLYFEGQSADFVLSGGEKGFYDTATARNAATWQVVDVTSDDYGAYGWIEASCDGCEKISPNGPVSIPLDENNNTIADSAPQDDNGASPRTDKDELPEADKKHPGDGYSNYEEYRGFFVGGVYVRTDIHHKDLMVNNQTGESLGWYPTSGIICRLINKDEMWGNREVNFNRGHATTGAQHGLIIALDKTGILQEGTMGKTYMRDENSMGPPGNVDLILLKEWTERRVAHEMGHATCVWHHGEMYPEATKIYDTKVGFFSGDNPLAAGLEDFLRWRKGLPSQTLCGRTLPHSFWIHEKGGTQSGDVNCVMKYVHYCNVYVDHGTYLCWPADVDGRHFCTSKTGTSYNANGAVGGDAIAGNCLGQIRVNDK